MMTARPITRWRISQQFLFLFALLALFGLAASVFSYRISSTIGRPPQNHHGLVQLLDETSTPTPVPSATSTLVPSPEPATQTPETAPLPVTPVPSATSEPERTATPSPTTQTPETAPLPVATATPVKPSWWVRSKDGGKRVFGVITAILPAGFTNQGGASVFGDIIGGVPEIPAPARAIRGTEFAFGIWPAVDQVDYQKPIEFRITVDAAQVAPGTEGQLTVQMYNPERKQWDIIPSQFRPATYQVITFVQSFKPIPKNSPSWGGRTFFILAYPAPTTATQPAGGPVVNRNANLRAGPGVNYRIVGKVTSGQSLNLIEKTADGKWYRLDSGAWISASLVNNAPKLPVAKTISVLPATP